MVDALWGFDAADFPLPSLLSNPTPLVQLADPVIYQLGNFFANVLNANLLPRFSDEAHKCGLTHANMDNWVDGYAVNDIIPYPINPALLKVTAFAFPLLSIYPEKESYHSVSLMKTGKMRDLVISWVLPPMTPRQYNHMYPFLGVASSAMEIYGQQGVDPKVNPNRSVWNIAGLSFGSLNTCDYKPYMGLDAAGKNAYFPSIQMRLSFVERSQIVNQGYPAFESAYVELDLYDGYNISNPIDNFIDGYVAPTMTMTSASPATGTVQGGTWITVTGTGFVSNLIGYPWQITVCGAQASSFAILNKTQLRIITSPSIGGAIGIGSIVITDTQSNTVSLHNSFTYTSP